MTGPAELVLQTFVLCYIATKSKMMPIEQGMTNLGPGAGSGIHPNPPPLSSSYCFAAPLLLSDLGTGTHWAVTSMVMSCWKTLCHKRDCLEYPCAQIGQRLQQWSSETVWTALTGRVFLLQIILIIHWVLYICSTTDIQRHAKLYCNLTLNPWEADILNAWITWLLLGIWVQVKSSAFFYVRKSGR